MNGAESTRQMRQLVDRLHGHLDVNPALAMLGLVQEAASNVEFYGTLVRQLAPSVDEWPESLERDDNGKVLIVSRSGIGPVGVAGRVEADKLTATPHVLVRMYNEERDRLAKYCDLAMRAGVSERLTRLAENQGRAIVKVLDAAFERLQLTTDQQAALPGIMAELLAPVPGALDVAELEAPHEG